MKVSEKEYSKMVQKASPNTKILKNTIKAFIVGGIICTIGQVLYNLYIKAGLDENTSRTVVSISLIGIAAILTMLHLYDNIGKFGGAGSIVPITGFSNSVVSPAIEFKSEGYILGLGAKMFIIAGPVIVYGVCTSVLYGLILWIFKLY